MGNDHNRGRKYNEFQNFGQIFVQTDKPVYYVNDTLQATIFLNIFQMYPGNRLIIELKGKEHIHYIKRVVVGTRMNNNNVPEDVYEDRYFKKKDTILSYEFPLYQWNQTAIMPGQYMFPFAMKLPSDIPGSFYIKRHKLMGSVGYYMTARLVSSYGVRSGLKFKTRIAVRPLPQLGQLVVKQEAIGNMVCCGCCCNCGQNRLTATFEKDSYIPGEVVRVKAMLDNSSSKVDCTSLQVRLYHIVKLRTDEHTFEQTYNLVTVSMPGVSAGSRSPDQFTELILPQPDKGDLWDCYDGSIQDLIRSLPSDYGMNTLANSSISEYITSEHYLEVTPEIGGCCSCCVGGAADVRVPVHIHPPEATPMLLPQQPQNWAPQQMPMVSYTSLQTYYKGGNPKFNGSGNGTITTMNQTNNGMVQPYMGVQQQQQQPQQQVQYGTMMQPGMSPQQPNSGMVQQQQFGVEMQPALSTQQQYSGMGQQQPQYGTMMQPGMSQQQPSSGMGQQQQQQQFGVMVQPEMQQLLGQQQGQQPQYGMMMQPGVQQQQQPNSVMYQQPGGIMYGQQMMPQQQGQQPTRI